MYKNAVKELFPYNQPLATKKVDWIGFLIVILALILLPFERVILPSSLKPVDLVLVILVGYGMVKIMITGRRIFFPLIIPFWLILIASLIATLGGLDKLASLIAIAQEIYLYLWFLFMTNLLIGFSYRSLDLLMKIWTIIAVAQAVFTLLGMLTIGPDFFYTSPENRVLISYTGLARGLGTFVNPNATGAYLSISFFIALGNSWQKWLRYIFSLIIFAGMFGSGSLGALISTFLGSLALILLTYYWAHPREPIQRKILFICASAILFFAFFVLLYFFVIDPYAPMSMEQKWLATTLGRFPRSYDQRLVLLNQAWSAYKTNPLGIGPNASQLLLGTIHNDYAAYLFERGVLGLIGWLMLIGSCLYFPLASARKVLDPDILRSIIYLMIGFFACAINAFTHEVSHFRQLWMLLAFLFALNYMIKDKSIPLVLNG